MTKLCETGKHLLKITHKLKNSTNPKEFYNTGTGTGNIIERSG